MNYSLTEPLATAVKAKLFRGLSDPSRLSILEALQKGPQTVGALVACTGLSQPNTSNHLNCLFDCGLVTRLPRGRHVVYALFDPRVGELLRLAEELLIETAQGVEACARYEDRQAAPIEAERTPGEVGRAASPAGERR